MFKQTKTKIVATIGPASSDVLTLERMIKAGLRVARLNFSHGTHKSHAKFIRNVRAAARKVGVEVAILQDLQGPRIRIGDVPEDGIKIKRGQKVALLPANGQLLRIPDHTIIPIQYKDLYKDVKKGTMILIEDGTIQLKVVRVSNKRIYCKVKIPGIIKSHKGINVPDVTLKVDVITAKDKKDIIFGQQHDVDFVALSFVKEAADINRLKKLIAKAQKKNVKVPTKVIAKIERKEAIERLPGILEAVDGIMVARGDLGIELPAEQVPLLQKELIQRCLQRGKPVIVATQMLDSMIYNPQPTRAEVSDVANAVIDHTDAIMLSGETATGKYPVEAVKMMTRTAMVTEASVFDDFDCGPLEINGLKQALAHAACRLSAEINAKAMIVVTKSGDGVRYLTRHRPELPILALTPELKTQRQLALSWGVVPKRVSSSADLQHVLKQGLEYLRKLKVVKKGDTVVLAASDPYGKIKEQHVVQILRVE